MSNQLQFEKSPYLLQHKNNPVNWLPWGKDAFDLARAQDQPVFLSIGYSTCHWCHVMAHESFEDEAVASILNRVFVPVKVDREERPDVDAVYMAACTAMTGSGGWPLTVLLTPEQKPFWAGTYLPKKALLSLATQVERLWRENREHILATGDELTAYLQQETLTQSATPRRELLVEAAAQYTQSFDPEWGGFGRAPKFPTPHNLLFLMRYAACAENGSAMEMAEKTLESMYRGGLFDHVGGGFSRYSTDERWLVPHFEKMLYDNALLLYTYAEAFQRTRRPLYASAARRTADYVLRELQSPEGGFFCGQDADSEGVEGKYYVFTPEELTAALGKEDAERFCRRYGITAQGNFEGKSIPNLIGQENIDTEPEGMDTILEKLRAYRETRTALHKDDKILTAWNGLMIAALAKVGLVLEDERCLQAAERSAAMIREYLTNSRGRLFARRRDGKSAIPGKLEDYAFLTWGLLELYAATFSLPYLAEAEHLAAQLLNDFFDHERGGLYPYASDDEQLLTRTKEVYDGAMPSGNAVAGLVFSRLARLTGEIRWKKASERQFFWLAGAVQNYPAGHSFTLLALLEELWPSEELICTARELPQELLDFLRREPRTALSVLLKTPENQEQLAALAPFTANYPIPVHGAKYYLCRGGVCAQPTDSIASLNW